MYYISPLELLKRQYLQQVNPDKIRLPSIDVLRLPKTQEQIFNLLFANGALNYPPPDRYQYRVLKRLINAMEQAIDDPEEDVGSPCNMIQMIDSHSLCPSG